MSDENVDYTYTKAEIAQLVNDLSQQATALGCQNIRASVKTAVGELTTKSMQIPEKNMDIVIILESVCAQYLALENEERLSGESGRNKTKLQILERFLELFYEKFQENERKLTVSMDGFDQTLNLWLREKGCSFTN